MYAHEKAGSGAFVRLESDHPENPIYFGSYRLTCSCQVPSDETRTLWIFKKDNLSQPTDTVQTDFFIKKVE